MRERERESASLWGFGWAPMTQMSIVVGNGTSTFQFRWKNWGMSWTDAIFLCKTYSVDFVKDVIWKVLHDYDVLEQMSTAHWAEQKEKKLLAEQIWISKSSFSQFISSHWTPHRRSPKRWGASTLELLIIDFIGSNSSPFSPRWSSPLSNLCLPPTYKYFLFCPNISDCH